MGRKRKHDTGLPRWMQKQHGAYFYVRHRRWTWLAPTSNYGLALHKYGELVGDAPRVTTVGEAIAHYLESHVDNLAPATIEGYRNSARRIAPVFGHLPLNALKASDVYRYLKESGGTVVANRDRALLSVAYTHARNIGAFDGSDPTKGLHYRNPEHPRGRYVTDDELVRLLDAASKKMATIIRFAYLTGIRQGDIRRLRCSDLTPEGIYVRQGKTGTAELIIWTPELRRVVDDAKRFWRRFGREYLFESIPRGRHAGRNPGPYTPSGMRALFRAVRKKAGVADVRFHDLRRKGASDKETLLDAQEFLAHADSKITKRHYRAKGERVLPMTPPSGFFRQPVE